MPGEVTIVATQLATRKSTTLATPAMNQVLAPYEKTQAAARGQILFREGEEPNGVYFLHSGQVDLVFAARNGDSKSLRVAEDGQILGLSSVVSRRPYDCTATAKTAAVVGFIPTDVFQRLLDQQPNVWLAVLKLISADVNACWDCMRTLSGVAR